MLGSIINKTPLCWHPDVMSACLMVAWPFSNELTPVLRECLWVHTA